LTSRTQQLIPIEPPQLDAFIRRWQAANGSERANYQLFLTALWALLGLPRPLSDAVTQVLDALAVLDRAAQEESI